MEHYGTNAACRSAVNAFMNGWVSQIHARGNLAGVYGSTLCNTGLSDFLNITNVPDVIWPARWYHSLGLGYYDPNASVWNLGSCVPNTVWSNHQRIRQYEGDHDETWGNLTLDIDSNVLDGVVAIPKGPMAANLVSPNGTITDNTPTYTWNKVSEATWYNLYVSGPSGYVFTQWYQSMPVCGASTCSIANATTLGGGKYRWWVQTWNLGVWSVEYGHDLQHSPPYTSRCSDPGLT